VKVGLTTASFGGLISARACSIAPVSTHRSRTKEGIGVGYLASHGRQGLEAGNPFSSGGFLFAPRDGGQNVALANALAGEQASEIDPVDLREPLGKRRSEDAILGSGCRRLSHCEGGGAPSKRRRRDLVVALLFCDDGRGVAFARESGKQAADGELHTLVREQSFNRRVDWRLNFHSRLVSLQLDKRLAHDDLVANLLQPSENLGALHRRAEFWDNEIHRRTPRAAP
jgi:hypothetical protein